MGIRRASLPLLLSCLLIGVLHSSVQAKDNWILLRTKHFTIASNADEGRTRERALKLEQFRFVFSKLFNMGDSAQLPITVIVFKNDDSYKPYKPLYNGKPANVAGYFQPGDDGNFISLNIDGNQLSPMHTIFHEYTHLLTSLSPYPWPLWLNEGLAEFYSTFDVEGKGVVNLGLPIGHHVLFLRQSKFLPLQSLISVGHGSRDYNEKDKQGVFYAESWALVHYLMFGDKFSHQKDLINFVSLVGSGVRPVEAFSQAFKTDFATIEKGLRNYILSNSYTNMKYPLGVAEGEKEVTSRPLAEAEVKSYLGNLLLHIHRIEDAENVFKEANQLDPQLAGPYEGLGVIAMRRNDYSTAKQRMSEALTRDPKSFIAHYYLAEALRRQSRGDRDQALVKRIRNELRASINLMQGFAPPYYALGHLNFETGEETDEGIIALQGALLLSPRRKEVRLTLAQLQMKKQNYEEAKKTLEPLLADDPDTSPGLKSAAESMINQIEKNQTSGGATEGSQTRTGQPPTLQRRADDAAAERTDRESGKQPAAGRLPPVRIAAPGREGPTVKFEGTEFVRGSLSQIECKDGGMVLVFKTESAIVRFRVPDPGNLQFLSQDPNSSLNIGCGPINLSAFVHFKRISSEGSGFAGDAIAVEFIKER
jgi:tetratricopeptide (TPR) repeat protein